MANTRITTAQNTTLTQLNKANRILKGLAVNVTLNDRKEVGETLGIIRQTISIYLAGNGKDLDLAMKLIIEFQKHIGDREKKLMG